MDPIQIMSIPLLSYETSPSASLNRVQIMALPGLTPDPAVLGRRGHELVSSRALIAFAVEHAAALDLAPHSLDAVTPDLTQSAVGVRRQVPLVVAAALTSEDPVRRAAAETVARRLGRNLGWLIAALHRGDDANRAVRPDWQAEDWERWAAIKRIWLGGGLSAGPLGEAIVTEALRLLAQVGLAEIELHVSPYRELVALVGAGRLVGRIDAAHNITALGLDFGETLVKRGGLVYRNGVLVGLEPLAARPADWQRIYPVQEDEAALGANVLAFIAETVAETLSELPGAEPLALLSVAAYVRQGRLHDKGPYGCIHAAAGDRPIDAIVGEAVAQRTGRVIAVRVVHDGTAASLAHAGSASSAMIMLGTALGVGFPPQDDGDLCPIANTGYAPF